MSEADPTGSLYIVSTPIGNLGDITYRSVETLRTVQVIAAEDTRRTRVLLNHYDISTRLSSFNSYNQEKKGREFIKVLESGGDVALVSDAGADDIERACGIRLRHVPILRPSAWTLNHYL